MARTTTPTSGRRQPGVTRGAKPAAAKPGRSSAAKKTASARKIATAAKSTTRAAGRATVQSKQELRDRIEKLERANVVLRTKNRETVEASRDAANRVDQLEEQLARYAATDNREPEQALVDEAPVKPVTRRGRKPRSASPSAEPLASEADDHNGV